MRTYCRRVVMPAVLVLLVLAGGPGCVPRDTLEKMQDQLNYLESSERRNRMNMERLDSLMVENTVASREMRADVYTALDELNTELAAIRQNMTDLMTKIDRRGTEHQVVVYQNPEVSDSNGGTGDVRSKEEPLSVDCGKIYDQAFNDLRNGNYGLAIEGFDEFLRTCASSPDMPRALYWLGECHYSNEDYAAAIEVFSQVIDDFPKSDRVPGALFKIGRCYEQTEQPRHARTYYERLINEFPKAIETRPAAARLRSIADDGDGGSGG